MLQVLESGTVPVASGERLKFHLTDMIIVEAIVENAPGATAGPLISSGTQRASIFTLFCNSFATLRAGVGSHCHFPAL